MSALTYEINQKKRDFDLTPGQYLTWNWGVSEFLPLKKDLSVLAEVGPIGYNSYQVTANSGSDASSLGTALQHVNGAGLQLGVTLPKPIWVFNFHWIHEYSSVNRFTGNAFMVTILFKLPVD
jgi:hypothetical protein